MVGLWWSGKHHHHGGNVQVVTEHVVLADLGCLGEADRLTCPIKKPAKPARLSIEQRTVNVLHSATRALAERGNSLLETTFEALRRVSLCPWRIGAITAAALVGVRRFRRSRPW
jgi:hypothetical protein